MLRSECWTAVTPDTFFCLRTWRKIWPSIAIGVRPVTAPRWPKVVLTIAFLVSAVALVISSLISFHRAPPTPTTRGPAPEAKALSALAAIPGKSIAVLPFENLSNEKENAYFADGVQDEILT